MKIPWEPGKFYHANVGDAYISDTDIQRVREALNNFNYAVYNAARYMSNQWTTDEKVYIDGTYTKVSGTYAKRIAKITFKTLGKGYSELPRWQEVLDVLSKVKPVSVEMILDFTQDFTWVSGAFGDSGSCYWSFNTHARNMLHYASAWAVRGWTLKKSLDYSLVSAVDGENTIWGCARAWMVPIPWRTYKETGEFDYMVVFNGQSRGVSLNSATKDLSRMTAALFQWQEPVSTSVKNNGYCDYLYTNGDDYLLCDSAESAEFLAAKERSTVNMDIPKDANDMDMSYGEPKKKGSYY